MIMKQKRTIIPIASGKGGVGKSLVTANLAIALAQMGHDTLSVDLDLGGSNLYTCLGLPNSYPGIGDFLRSPKKLKLNDLIVPTGIPNLRFLPGDGKTPFMANISFDQRMRLMKELKSISAEYILLDLGAGTYFNTLNFFGLSYQGLIVTSFETMSIMNFVMFLRNFIFRIICGIVRHDRQVLKKVIEEFRQPINEKPVTVQSLLNLITKMNASLGDRVKKICAAFKPRIIFNMSDLPEELNIIPKLTETLKNGLSMEAEYFGNIFFDETVRIASKKREVLLLTYPDCIASKCLRHIAAQLADPKQAPVENSFIRLLKTTKMQYDQWKRH